MTLLDLGRLLRRYIVLVIALPIACAAVCAGVLFVASSPSASTPKDAVSRIVVNSQLTGVAGLASSEARQAVLDYQDGDLTATAKGDGGTMTVTVTVDASGMDYASACSIANDIADKTVKKAELFYEAASERENMIPFAAYVEPANPDEEAVVANSKDGKMKYILAALLGGLFVAICIVVIIDMVRRPVKSIEGIQEAIELPVLEKLPVSDNGERLLANVRFASKTDGLTRVCVIPVGVGKPADDACEVLAAAFSAEGSKARIVRPGLQAKASEKAPETAASANEPEVIRCASMAEGMDAAYIARSADAVILVASQWSDSLKALESAAAELRLADTKLVGAVFSPEVKAR